MRKSDCGDDLGSPYCALFGGQGCSGGMMKELRAIVSMHSGSTDVLHAYLESISQALKDEISQFESGVSLAPNLLKYGLDIMAWANAVSPHDGPPLSYLESAAVSMPLILTIQLAAYLHCVLFCPDPAAVGPAATLGHSQGIAAAVVVALCPLAPLPPTNSDLAKFREESIRMAIVLLHLGIRIQLATLALTVAIQPPLPELHHCPTAAGHTSRKATAAAAAAAAAAAEAAAAGSWGLAVLHLSLEDLEAAVRRHNEAWDHCAPVSPPQPPMPVALPTAAAAATAESAVRPPTDVLV